MNRFDYEREQFQQWVCLDQEQPPHFRDVLVCCGANHHITDLLRIATYISQHSTTREDGLFVDTDEFEIHEGKEYLPAGFVYYKENPRLASAPLYYLTETVIAWQPLPMIPAFARQYMEKLAAAST